jgi:hypothetical protein
VDAIVNSKNLGDVFSNVAKQIIADLAAIAVRRSITEPLANMLFGGGQTGGSTGGGGFLASLGSFATRIFGGARASGGPVRGGFAYDVGEFGPERIVVPQDGFVLPNMPNGGATSNQRIQVVVETNDPMFTAHVRSVAAGVAAPMVESSEARTRQAIPGMAVGAVMDAQQRQVFR